MSRAPTLHPPRAAGVSGPGHQEHGARAAPHVPRLGGGDRRRPRGRQGRWSGPCCVRPPREKDANASNPTSAGRTTAKHSTFGARRAVGWPMYTCRDISCSGSPLMGFPGMALEGDSRHESGGTGGISRRSGCGGTWTGRLPIEKVRLHLDGIVRSGSSPRTLPRLAVPGRGSRCHYGNYRTGRHLQCSVVFTLARWACFHSACS